METYCKLVNEKIGQCLDDIGKAAKLNSTVIITEEVMKERNAWIWIDYEVNANWPVKSIDEVKEALKDFAKKGILLKEFIKDDVNPRWRLQHGEYTINLSPQWHRGEKVEEGVTCKLVQVGVKHYDQPIYKLVCNDVEEQVKDLNNLEPPPKEVNEDDPREDR